MSLNWILSVLVFDSNVRKVHWAIQVYFLLGHRSEFADEGRGIALHRHALTLAAQYAAANR